MTEHLLRHRHISRASADPFAGASQRVFARLGIRPPALAAIAARMTGKIVLPGMTEYPQKRMGSGLSPWDEGAPLLIFLCTSEQDVWVALQTTWIYGWGFTARSGGHSTAGFSSNAETVIDLSGMRRFGMIDEELLAVAPGVDFGTLNTYLATKGRHIPTGNCDNVCVGGYVQGGGYGYTSRQFGMQCDSLVRATLILGDGRTVIASADTNPDLFWAIRGGTGNNFGIVVEYVYRTVALGKIWGFVYTWPAEVAADALAVAQQAYGKDTGLAIGYTGNLTTVKTAEGGRAPVYMMSGICLQGKDAGLKALAPMLAIKPCDCLLDLTDYYVTVNEKVEDLLPGIPPPIEKTFEIKSSAYLSDPMSKADWQAFFDLFDKAVRTINPYNLIVLEAYGGAINKVGKLDTAFVHRDALMNIYVDAFWSEDEERLGSFDANQAWMDEVSDFLAQRSNGEWYQNYPQRNMPDFRHQYWGDAFASLLFVKGKFDPAGRFTYGQSISPYPDDSRARRSSVPSIWNDMVITDTGRTPRFLP